MKYKEQKIVFQIAMIGGGLFLFFWVLYRIFGWHIAFHFDTTCVMHNYFHLYCPGCGGTRAFDAFLRGEILVSVSYNPFFLLLAGMVGYYYLLAFYTFVIKKDGKIYYNIPVDFMIKMAVILVVYTILKNVLMIFWGIDPLQDLVVYWK